ncbi:MAG: peptidase C25, partial [Thermoplasmata archaeon]
MKKMLSVAIVYMIVLSGLGVTAVSVERDSFSTSLAAMDTSKAASVEFSPPALTKGTDGYIRVECDEADYLLNPGKPLLPRTVKTFELPFGVRNVRVEMEIKGVQERTVSSQIAPAPAPMPLSPIDGYRPPGKDTELYSSHDMFPSSWYSYNVGCGLNGEMEHVTYVTVNIYPVRYVPADGLLYVADSADIRITYDPPAFTLPKKDTYELVIIAPQKFSSELQPLVDHKISHGVSTRLETTEEIYAQYGGVDEPEKIKYFIKDAVEQWGTKYVMLVGGLKSTFYAKPRDNANSGVTGWYVPVRYSNLVSGEPGYPCDMYYADIYKEGGEFDNWDSNGNGIFAEWTDETGQPEDVLDLYPDVAVGRLACRNIQEVRDVVNKIITY